MTDSRESRSLDRRRLLTGAAVLGAAAPVLAACGSSDGSGTSSGAGASSSAGTGSGASSSGSAGSGAALVATSDVPVGGGVILDAQKVVVTQPSDGQFKAFSAVCTHQGCLVGSVADGTITCPCHGSQFSADDGSVVNGPATSPLPDVDIEVDGGEVVRA